MFTPKQSVQWKAERYKSIRHWIKEMNTTTDSVRTVQMHNYAQLLVATFNILFNERQKKGSYHA
jgi:hypothetical protein